MRRARVTVTTIADGSATAYTPRLSGRLYSVHYTKHATTPFADGVDFVITSETTGQIIWDEDNVNATAHRAPHQPIHTQVGVAGLYAAAGEAVLVPIAVHGRIKIVIAAGGDSKVGTFDFLYED